MKEKMHPLSMTIVDSPPVYFQGTFTRPCKLLQAPALWLSGLRATPDDPLTVPRDGGLSPADTPGIYLDEAAKGSGGLLDDLDSFEPFAAKLPTIT